jgi:L-ascorbate metabolism protein UlaG (beta-lactamase superfamily)
MRFSSAAAFGLYGLLSLACSKGGVAEPPAEPGQSVADEHAAAKPEASTEARSEPSPPDIVHTPKGPLKITPVHHATLVFEFAGKTIWLDPWSQGDLGRAGPADYIFLTDIHPDHLDAAAVEQVRTDDTLVVGPAAVAAELPGTLVMKNGEHRDFAEFSVDAVAMYNIERGPEPGKHYHEKGRGNGYVFTFGDQRVYVSGDTECTDEMRTVHADIAFVCMNVPYTMPPEEAAQCVLEFKPKIVYPYHYRGSDLDAFEQPVSAAGIEVRLRNWY